MRNINICLALSLAGFLSFSALEVYSLTRFVYAGVPGDLKTVWQCYERGNELYVEGKYKEAQEEFQRALSLISLDEKDKIPEKKRDYGSRARAQEVTMVQEEAIQIRKSLRYTIAVGDVLQVSVWEWDNLNEEVIVQPDGMISFSLVGEIRAVGLTIPQLDQEITRRLKEYIKQPVVSISVKRMGGNKIIVLGEVGVPGVYSVTGKKTVLEAVALAGGFNNDAVLSSVILIRGGLENPKGERLNLSRTINKVDMSQNVALENEDIVYVPKKFIANVNYFVTEVLGPLVKGAESAQKISSGQFFRDTTTSP